MYRVDDPSRSESNRVARWLQTNWQHDTKALVVVSQLYWVGGARQHGEGCENVPD